jgi:hypothetical protein
MIFQEDFMKNKRGLLIVAAALIALFMAACSLDMEGGTVIVTNNSNRDFYGRVWTDSKELYNGKIRAWNSKSFRVSEEGTVYTDFESGNGGKSNPSGYVSRNRTLILDL